MVHWSGHPLAGSNLQSRQSGVGGGVPESALRECKFASFRAIQVKKGSLVSVKYVDIKVRPFLLGKIKF